MIPALLGIFSAVGSAVELFEAGKRVYREVVGSAPAAETPQHLQAEVMALPAEQQRIWAQAMEQEVALYQAQTARLQLEQGQVTADMLSLLPPEMAARIAWLRMATRPRIVLWMAQVMLLPIYVLAFDGLMIAGANVTAAFGGAFEVRLLAITLFGPGSLYPELYSWAAGSAAAIVMAYMTARSIEKTKGRDDATPVANTAVTAASDLAGKIRGLIRR